MFPAKRQNLKALQNPNTHPLSPTLPLLHLLHLKQPKNSLLKKVPPVQRPQTSVFQKNDPPLNHNLPAKKEGNIPLFQVGDLHLLQS
jgi:hypothetical protein